MGKKILRDNIKWLAGLLLCLLVTQSYAQYDSLVAKIKTQPKSFQATFFLGNQEQLFYLKHHQALAYFKQVINYAQESGNKELLQNAKFFFNLWVVSEHGNYIESSTTLLNFYKNAGMLYEQGCMHHVLAQNYVGVKDYQNALFHYQSAYTIFEKIGFEHCASISKFFHDYTLTNYHFKDYNRVIELMQLSKKIPPYNANHHIQLYNNLAVAYLNLKSIDSAKFYFIKTYEQAKHYNNTFWIGHTQGNLAEAYLQDNDLESAYKYYSLSYKKGKELSDKIYHYKSNLNMAKIYLATDSLPMAKNHLDQASEIIKEMDYRFFGDEQQVQQLRLEFYKLKIAYSKYIGDYAQALAFHDSLIQISKEIGDQYNASIIVNTKDRIALENAQYNRELNDQKSMRQRLTFATIILLLGLTAVLIYLNYRNKKIQSRRNKAKLLSDQLITKLENERLQAEIQAAREDSTKFISEINHLNELLNSLEKQLEQMDQRDTERVEMISKSIDDLKSSIILTDKNWYEFQVNFNVQFPDVARKISDFQPSLTPSELRYVMLIKLGLTNKEISRLLGVSEGALRVTWNRLKKKLDITTQQSAAQVIEEIFGD